MNQLLMLLEFLLFVLTTLSFLCETGIVPRFCEELFESIRHQNKKEEAVYDVKFNMLEIYNEIVRDLLNPLEKNRKKGLRVREHPTKGFYGEFCFCI